ncbi:hypothetical protein FB45DRAFT_1126817 [Roridomyces roridus]|uniref:Zn(2)-C6 fungal-type domain-containing protein n=1 Tax=Roridomyces roridus TaxID=1738132 RepID=A0AAD7B430_9AGAR|nr:hypothetical protein FB45DRAFT_1126817 [Roridomyces roridus]
MSTNNTKSSVPPKHRPKHWPCAQCIQADRAASCGSGSNGGTCSNCEGGGLECTPPARPPRIRAEHRDQASGTSDIAIGDRYRDQASATSDIGDDAASRPSPQRPHRSRPHRERLPPPPDMQYGPPAPRHPSQAPPLAHAYPSWTPPGPPPALQMFRQGPNPGMPPHHPSRLDSPGAWQGTQQPPPRRSPPSAPSYQMPHPPLAGHSVPQGPPPQQPLPPAHWMPLPPPPGPALRMRPYIHPQMPRAPRAPQAPRAPRGVPHPPGTILFFDPSGTNNQDMFGNQAPPPPP